MRHEPMRHDPTGRRRGALLGASAAVLCLGGVLAACGGGGSDGYTAVGAADGSARSPGAVAPSGDVSLAPLDGGAPGGSNTPGNTAGSGGGAPVGSSGASSAGGTNDTAGSAGPAAGSAGTGGPATGDGGSGAAGAGSKGSGSGSSSPSGGNAGGGSGRTGGSSGGTSGGSSGGSPGTTAPTPTASAGPAVLSVEDTSRAVTDRRWCEKVTVSFANTGGTAVRSGTVTFGTHVIGSLGIDWATIRSAEDLPVPIAPGATRSRTWTVCVDSWRVPLGMHVETRDVSVRWE
ncbi:hypothetical protein [Streptomyces sp. NPDC127038]|uniref:hypothetical protein n=1 Tax=Streptomyces sp. NPDC127038 TaxID=3347114 RepID=UPI00365279DB